MCGFASGCDPVDGSTRVVGCVSDRSGSLRMLGNVLLVYDIKLIIFTYIFTMGLLSGVETADALVRRDIWLMLLAALVLSVAMLSLFCSDTLRARYNRYCLGRDGERLVLDAAEGQVKALGYQRTGPGQGRLQVDVRMHSAGPKHLAALRYRLVVDLDCVRQTSRIVSAPRYALPEQINPDGDAFINGAGWLYLLQQQYCD